MWDNEKTNKIMHKLSSYHTEVTKAKSYCSNSFLQFVKFHAHDQFPRFVCTCVVLRLNIMPLNLSSSFHGAGKSLHS